MHTENKAQHALKKAVVGLTKILGELKDAGVEIDEINAPSSGNHSIKPGKDAGAEDLGDDDQSGNKKSKKTAAKTQSGKEATAAVQKESGAKASEKDNVGAKGVGDGPATGSEPATRAVGADYVAQ